MRIDAHQHYWKLSRNDYGWITPDMPVLYRDYLPEDLMPHLQKHGVERTILVQAAATIEETEFLLRLSEQTETVGGVVGWLDLNDPSYRAHFERFRKHPKFVGFRVMIQEMEDPRDVLKPQVVEALTYFAEIDFPVDLLMRSPQLHVVVELLERVPGLRGVIDHLAKPRIAEAVLHPWQDQMREIARHPNIYCKLSGMVTEADHVKWTANDLIPYVRHVLEIFGPDRVMFGSDWPVCLLAASYDQVVDALEQALPDTLTESEKERIFGGNAKTFYKL